MEKNEAPHFFTRTKIVATLGPATNSYETIVKLIESGMNIARINFSHGTAKEHLETFYRIKKAREEKQVCIPILLDTKGAEVRLGQIPGGEKQIHPHDTLWLSYSPVQGSEPYVPLYPKEVLSSLKTGMHILIDDGKIKATIKEVRKEAVLLLFEQEAILKSGKSVHIPEASFSLPLLSEEDREDIILGCKEGADIIAASFISYPEQMREIKKIVKEQGREDIALIAKIESREGVANFEYILAEAEGIMVARGDLGVEFPLEEIPHLQKKMIQRCLEEGKPVVTATQMLESMIASPRPTRAEVSDVANALYDGSSCVMLSAETASGKYPVEAVHMMHKIIVETEREIVEEKLLTLDKGKNFTIEDIPTALAFSCVSTERHLKVGAIFVFATKNAFIIKQISRFRPSAPIIALTPDKKLYNQLGLYWGVIPLLPCKVGNTDKAFSLMREFALEKGWIKKGDFIVVVLEEESGESMMGIRTL